MTKLLKPQLDNHVEIRKVLKELTANFTIKKKKVETLLVYLPCNDGECKHADLFRIIKQNILTKFTLSYSEIEKKLSIPKKHSVEKLFNKAARKISQHTAQGELGELLLFTLLEVYFNAPKIFSKMSHKTSRTVPVFGADAVHAQYVDNKLRLYLGESKLHKSFPKASDKAVVSISNALNNYDFEFDLIESHIDFPEIDDKNRQEILDLLNPFEDTRPTTEILHTPCFIGFEKVNIFSDDIKIYQKQYIKVAEKYVKSFYKKLEKQGCEMDKTALFLLPFSSLTDLVEEFISYMGIEK